MAVATRMPTADRCRAAGVSILFAARNAGVNYQRLTEGRETEDDRKAIEAVLVRVRKGELGPKSLRPQRAAAVSK